MQIALTLLISAQTLLAMVMGNPTLPQDFKDNAIVIATNAIKVAQEELQKPVEVVTIPIQQKPQVQNLSQPSFGSIIVPMDKSDIKLELAFIGKKDAENGLPFGSYHVRAELLDSNGKNVKMADVTMSAPDSFYGDVTHKMDSITNENKEGWYHTYSYVPTKAGEKVITFTGNGISRQITINVD